MARTRSGKITVTTAGTAVAGPAFPKAGGTNKLIGFYIKALADNTDTVYVGNDGLDDVSSANGFPLDPGETVLIEGNSLSNLWFDADISGEGVAWLSVAP